MKKTFLFMAAACMMLVGCDKNEQSQFTLNDLSGKALVQGKVVYDAGCTEVGGVIYSKNIKPAANVQLLLSVKFADYASGEGNKQYFATTDAEGRYSFEVPVGAKAVEGQLEVLPFSAAKGFEVDNKVVEVSNAVFDQNVGPKTVNLEDSKLVVENFDNPAVATREEMDANKLSGEKGFTVHGFVKLKATKWVDKEDARKGAEATTKPAPRDAKVRIVVSNNKDAEASTITYETSVANAETGEYSIDIKFFDAWSFEDVKVKAEVLSFYVSAEHESAFANLYASTEDLEKTKSQSLSGVYEKPAAVEQVNGDGELVKQLKMKMAEMVMTFKPDEQVVNGVTRVKYGKKDDGNMYISHTSAVSDIWNAVNLTPNADDQW